MMDLNTVWEWIISGLVQNFVWVIVAIAFVQFVQRAYDGVRYGRWKVIVRENGKDRMMRNISPGKVKEILGESSEMSVYIKGVTSPYGWINCDILTEGKEIGLFTQDDENRRLIVNLDKNPRNGNETVKKLSPKKKRRS